MATMNGVRASPPRLDHAAPVAVSSPAKRKRAPSVETPAPSNGSQSTTLKQEPSDAKNTPEPSNPPSSGINGVKPIPEVKPATSSLEDQSDGKTVLTLFGSAPQPRQLFTTLRKSLGASSDSLRDTSSEGTGKDGAGGASPISEVTLPNGITTTNLLAVDLVEEPPEKIRRGPTLGEVFPAPATLAQLLPPKPSKHTSTRGPTVDWFKPSETELPPDSFRRGTYPTQPLTTGKSLSYNAPPAAPRAPSPDAKRRQRERTLSSEEAKAEIPTEILAAHQAAATDALFRRAFSGFAPTHDDSAAIVPEETKNTIWWERVGEDRYERLVHPHIFPESALNKEDGIDSMEVDGVETKAEDDEIKQEAINSWVVEDAPDVNAKLPKGGEIADKDVEEVLNDISELLEMLNSYQRTRHLNPVPLSSPTRPGSVPMNPSADVTGTPSSPSSNELLIYKTLKSQLSLLVAGLPPYAVAKLDGEQLAQLNITTKFPLDVRDFKGVMEPEEVPVPIKPKVSAAAPSANVRGGSYSTPQPQRSHSSASGPPPPRTAPHGVPPGGYYPPQPPQHGSPSRPSRAQPRPTPPPPGAGYGQMPFNGQPPRPGHPGPPGPYGQPTNPGQYFQQPAYNNYPIQYQGGPPPPHPAGSPPQHSPYQRPSQPAYQQHAKQRPQQQHLYPPHPYAAQGPPPPPGGPRSVSPQKSPYPPSPHAHQPQPPLHMQQRGGGPPPPPPPAGYPSPHQHSPPPHHLPHGQPPPQQPYPPRQYFQQNPSTPGAPMMPQHPTPPLPPHQQHHPQQQQQQHQQQQQSLPPRNSTPGGPPPSQPVGASGFHTYMTAEQQALMMERQRAQLAASASQMQGQGQNQRAVVGNAAIPAPGGGAVMGVHPQQQQQQPVNGMVPQRTLTPQSGGVEMGGKKPPTPTPAGA